MLQGSQCCRAGLPHLAVLSRTVAGEAKFKDISWFSPNGERLSPNQQRISVVRNDDFSSTLTIYNANIDDAGIYKCVVSSPEEGDSEATVNVKIFRKAAPARLLHCTGMGWVREKRCKGKEGGRKGAVKVQLSFWCERENGNQHELDGQGISSISSAEQGVEGGDSGAAGRSNRGAGVGGTHLWCGVKRSPRVQRVCDELSAPPAGPCQQLLPPCWAAPGSHLALSGNSAPVGTGLDMGVLWALHSLRPLSSPGNKETPGDLGVSCFPQAGGRSTAPGVLESCSALLLSLSAEKLMFRNAPTPQEFKEGDDAVIVCDVVSSLPPTIIWKHKGRDVILKKDGKGLVLVHSGVRCPSPSHTRCCWSLGEAVCA